MRNKIMLKNQKKYFIISLPIIYFFILFFGWFIGPIVIETIYHKKAFFLNCIITGQDIYPLNEYIDWLKHDIKTFFRCTFLPLFLFYAFISTPYLFADRFKITRKKLTSIFFVFISFIVISRFMTYKEPFERDLMIYSVVAEAMLEGHGLYSEMWDHKPPAIHHTYALAIKIFGYGPLMLYALGCITTIITLFGVYCTGIYFGGQKVGLTASFLWCVLSGDFYLQANQPNVEVFINFLLIWSFFIILKNNDKKKLLYPVNFGLLIFIASLYKTIVAPIALFFILFRFISDLAELPDRSKKNYLKICLFPASAGLTIITGWMLVFLYYLIIGHFEPFYDTVFTYNREYAGNLINSLFKSLNPYTHTHPIIIAYVLLFLSSITGILHHLIKTTHIKSQKRNLFLLSGYLCGSWVGLSLPNKFFPHYYQLLMPGLVIGSSWLLYKLKNYNSKYFYPFVFIIFALFTTHIYQYTITTEKVSLYKYGLGHGVGSIESKKIGLWLKNNIHEKKLIYVWGAEPGIYFWGDLKTPNGFTYNYPLIDNTKRANIFTGKVLTKLNESHPDLIIANRKSMKKNHPITHWIDKNYKKKIVLEDITKFDFYYPSK